MASQLDIVFFIAELNQDAFLHAAFAAWPRADTPLDVLRLMAWDQFFEKHEDEAWEISLLPWEMDVMDPVFEDSKICVPLAMISVPLQEMHRVPIPTFKFERFA